MSATPATPAPCCARPTPPEPTRWCSPTPPSTLYNGKCVRASAGSLFHLPVVTGLPVDKAVADLKDRGLRILAADGTGKQTLDDVDLSAPRPGCSATRRGACRAEVLALADEVVRVPIYGRAESLNLATAAAVCLYASARVLRQT